jgi:hypothetical protein
MREIAFKKILLISFACHACLILFFGFSFGKKQPVLHYSPAVFWGQILNAYDFSRTAPPDFSGIGRLFAGDFLKALRPAAKAANTSAFETPCLKPEITMPLLRAKQDLSPALANLHAPKRKEPVITFHPLLPQHFILYFKDRQTAHIEVMFKVVSGGKDVNPIILERKISSGNLEADLLSMRYIGHYLFIQEKRFVPDTWHTAKIDLSP